MRRTLSSIAIYLCLGSLNCLAQDQQPAPSSDAQKQIDDNAIRQSKAAADKAEADVVASQIANAKAQVDLDQAKKDNAVKNLPQPTVTPPDGSLSITDASKLVESQLLSYVASRNLIVDVARETIKQKSCVKSVAIVQTADLDQVQIYKSFLAQLDFLTQMFVAPQSTITELSAFTKESFDGNKSPFAAFDLSGVLSAAQSIGETTAELVGLLQSKSSLAGVDVTLKQDAIEAQFIRELQHQNPAPTVSDVHLSAQIPQDATEDSSRLMKQMQDLSNLSNVGQKSMDQLDSLVARLTTEVAANIADLKARATAGNDNKDKIANIQKNFDAYTARVKAADTAMAAAIAAVNKVKSDLTQTSGGTATLLLNLLKAESMKSVIAAANCLAEISPASSGGGVLTVQNLWTFFGAPRIYHSGGVALTFFIFDRASRAILTAGTVSGSSGYVKSSKVKDVLKEDFSSQKFPPPDKPNDGSQANTTP